MPDKRNYARLYLHGKAVLTLEAEPSRVLEGELCNISSGGFCFSYKEVLPRETAVLFEITLDDDWVILKGKAIVRNTRKEEDHGRKYYLLGAEFIETDRTALLTLLNTRARRQPPQTTNREPDLGAY
jgi:hypothetical protein